MQASKVPFVLIVFHGIDLFDKGRGWASEYIMKSRTLVNSRSNFDRRQKDCNFSRLFLAETRI